MKFIINESQYNRLLTEQKVYTGETEYKKALKEFEVLSGIYKDIIGRKKVLDDFYKRWDITDWDLESAMMKEDHMKIKKAYDKARKLKIKYQITFYEFVFSEGILIKKTKWNGTWSDYDNPNTKFGTGYGQTNFLIPVLTIGKPVKPVYKKPEPKPVPVVNPTPVQIVTPNVDPVVNNTKPPEPIKTNFSATFGWDGKQETKYFKNFNEWYNFYNSTKGKFGFINANYNNSETEASMSLKGEPSDWGL